MSINTFHTSVIIMNAAVTQFANRHGQYRRGVPLRAVVYRCVPLACRMFTVAYRCVQLRTVGVLFVYRLHPASCGIIP